MPIKCVAVAALLLKATGKAKGKVRQLTLTQPRLFSDLATWSIKERMKFSHNRIQFFFVKVIQQNCRYS